MTEKQPVKHTEGNKVVDDENEDLDNMDYSDDEGTVVDGIRIPPAIKPTCSFDPTGPRLIITKITNNFFKSFANQQILGPFHKVCIIIKLEFNFCTCVFFIVFQCCCGAKR